MSNSTDGRTYIQNLLDFWKEQIKEYLQKQVLSSDEQDEFKIIEGLLNTDAPIRLWEECQGGIFHEKTIKEVEKIDDAIFRLKFRFIQISPDQRKVFVEIAEKYESLVVFCICNALRREGRLIEG